MRDNGFNFYWQDKYTKNLFAQGFEWDERLPIHVVTTFESFEHFVEPRIELEKLLSISRTIIFSTETYPDNSPIPQAWWYFGLEHGQHISFYSIATFEYLALNYHLNYYNYGSLHILTDKNLSFFEIKTSSLARFGVDKFIKKGFLKSKTQSDYQNIIQKLTKIL